MRVVWVALAACSSNDAPADSVPVDTGTYPDCGVYPVSGQITLPGGAEFIDGIVFFRSEWEDQRDDIVAEDLSYSVELFEWVAWHGQLDARVTLDGLSCSCRTPDTFVQGCVDPLTVDFTVYERDCTCPEP